MINKTLLENEKNIVNTLYEYFRETGKWISAPVLHQKIGRKIIEDITSQSTQLIIKYKESGNRIEYYKLTFLGIYLCPEAKEDIELLCRYINLLKHKFNENPEIQKLISLEVETSLNLTKGQSRILRDFIYIGNIYGINATIGEEEWEFSVPNDIEYLLEIDDPKKYLEKHIEKEIQREKEKTKKCRKLKEFRYQVGFWVLLIILLWRELFDIKHYSLKILPYYVTFILLVTLYAIVKIFEVFKIKVFFFSSKKIQEKILGWLIITIISVMGGLITKFLSK